MIKELELSIQPELIEDLNYLKKLLREERIVTLLKLKHSKSLEGLLMRDLKNLSINLSLSLI